MASRGDTHMDEETSQGVVSDVLVGFISQIKARPKVRG